MTRRAIGLVLACLGSVHLALYWPETVQVLAITWPYILLTYAVANGVSAVVEPAVAIAPLVLLVAAIAAVLFRTEDLRFLSLIGVLSLGTGILLNLTKADPIGQRTVALGWTIRKAPIGTRDIEDRVLAILGTAHLDLRGVAANTDGARVSVRTVVGAAHIRVPAGWRVALEPRSADSLVSILERGSRDKVTDATQQIALRTSGLAGIVIIERT